MKKVLVLLAMFYCLVTEAQQFVLTHTVKVENKRVVEQKPCNCSFRIVGKVIIITHGEEKVYLVESNNSFVREEKDFAVFKFDLQTEKKVYNNITIHIVKGFRGIVMFNDKETNGFGYINLNNK